MHLECAFIGYPHILETIIFPTFCKNDSFFLMDGDYSQGFSSDFLQNVTSFNVR